jgi:hypothetical protein
MKTLKLIALAIFLFASTANHAQVSVSVNIGTPPLWGPVGYSQVQYYYLPDVQAYYDIRTTQFIYFGNGAWIRSSYLPRQYRNYDLYSGYKVVLNDYHGTKPYSNFKSHKAKYYKGYNKGYQENYRTANQKKQGQGNHNNGNHGNGNGNGNGNGKNGNHGNGNGKH